MRKIGLFSIKITFLVLMGLGFSFIAAKAFTNLSVNGNTTGGGGSGSTPSLSQVTAVGASTTDSVIFNKNLTVGNKLFVPNGTAAQPSIAFSNATDTGLFYDPLNVGTLNIAASGTRIAEFDGSPFGPAIYFLAGVFPDNVGSQVLGNLFLPWGSEAVNNIYIASGTTALPGISFQQDTTTGMEASGGGISWSIDGVEKMGLTANGILSGSQNVSSNLTQVRAATFAAGASGAIILNGSGSYAGATTTFDLVIGHNTNNDGAYYGREFGFSSSTNGSTITATDLSLIEDSPRTMRITDGTVSGLGNLRLSDTYASSGWDVQPSYTFKDSTNTGMFLNAMGFPNRLGLTASGTLMIDMDGGLGRTTVYSDILPGSTGFVNGNFDHPWIEGHIDNIYSSTTILGQDATFLGNASTSNLQISGVVTSTGSIIYAPNIAALGATGKLVCQNGTTGYLQVQSGSCIVSSLRFKEHIKSLSREDLMEKVRKLRAVIFDYKEGRGDGSLGTPTDEGFIAEEVAQIDPYIVSYERATSEDLKQVDKSVWIRRDDGVFIPKTVDYSRVSVLLTGAVQNVDERLSLMEKITEQQQKEIDELKKEIRSLK